MQNAREHIDRWLVRLDEAPVFSPSEVQSVLFTLYGELSEGPALEQVKRWLSLTIERELFGADELREVALGLLFELSFPAGTHA